MFDIKDDILNLRKTPKDSSLGEISEEEKVDNHIITSRSFSNCNILPGAALYIHKMKQ